MKDRYEKMEGSDGAINAAPSHSDKIRATNRLMVDRFERKCPKFLIWLSMLNRFGGNPIDSMMLWELSEGRPIYKARFFTDRFEYTIAARPGENVDKPYDSYLGAVMSSRKPRAGEDWMRGNDLGDGEYTEDVWIRIMADIISHELVRLGK